jgi:hypothetical protein
MTRQFEMRELAAHELDKVAGGNPIAIGLIVLGAFLKAAEPQVTAEDGSDPVSFSVIDGYLAVRR